MGVKQSHLETPNFKWVLCLEHPSYSIYNQSMPIPCHLCPKQTWMMGTSMDGCFHGFSAAAPGGSHRILKSRSNGQASRWRSQPMAERWRCEPNVSPSPLMQRWNMDEPWMNHGWNGLLRLKLVDYIGLWHFKYLWILYMSCHHCLICRQKTCCHHGPSKLNWVMTAAKVAKARVHEQLS